MHLAELNVARPKYALDDPRIADFMNALDRVNALAERSPGFVWRLTGTGNDATDLRLPGEPDTMLNISVWENGESLKHFVWNTVHRRFYRRKAEWFEHLSLPYFVMWAVPPGHRPGAAEACDRLMHLRAHGPSDHAFGWERLAKGGSS